MTISNSNGSSFYGARSARRVAVKEFSKSEIANRIQNSNLVRLVDAYRSFGHKCANIDPLNMWHQSRDASLDPSTYGLDDPQAEYQLEGIVSMKGLSKATLAQIIEHLENVYCGHMAFEFMHITDNSLRRWFASQAETSIDTNFSKEEKYKFLELMTRSETFDHYMMRECGHRKQFSLEGSESALVALQQVLEHSSKAGVLEVVMCLTHRCRMQIMMELLGVPKDSLFRKFQGLSEFPDEIPSHIIGDLVYNAQASVDLKLGGKHPLHVSVVPNPCHLELVNPVALGKVRAKQEDYLSQETDVCKLELVDSPLGELAVMSYEYGMSLETPNRLNMWEAQLGDFFNSAQEVIDSFISGGEEKWLRQSGLVLVLPHGYEGAGPEHTSCRIERFLQLSSDRFNVTDPNVSNNVNWHVVNCSTPAQYFHVLRRQMKRNYRKPLIVVGPKRLTRIPKAVSDLDDFAPGTSFQPVISDMEANKLSVRRVIFVSGKLYYELLEERAKKEMVVQVALIRVEEYSPFPKEDLEAEISKYPSASEFVWCQEETQNGGAWYFMESRLNQLLPSQHKLKYIGRAACAAPANGIYVKHLAEQKQIYQEALALSSAPPNPHVYAYD
ncbi:hypothetical protein K493DRAFT_387202 [Basidiobolus meristosporus CBS 931.73]|uniref:Transketolase-like pyrimidine-binding domain-containing protein n=1 Tax=Basidiobolus meristosporus CBS 931.73 TaxID=1314790 RepID=A0A1Y1XGF7_9FUNG|nr:hypothetical protein K493DRAFT_387202 [Basidiobolus meristosporus CBS 931.73]|eukprot:ORX84849.1 hypothetical protein K493DRAFT_387202 [Basidiobolus meristosporus CBS 931.73]